MSKASEQTQRWQSSMRKQGRCVGCGRKLDRRGIQCVRCNLKSNDRKRRWRNRRLAEDRCPVCGNRHRRKGQLCRICNEAQKDRMKEWRDPVPSRKKVQVKSSELVRKAARLYTQEGMTLTEIGFELGVSGSTVSSWLKSKGIPRRHRGKRPCTETD